MRRNEVTKALLGGLAVYVAMAACGGGGATDGSGPGGPGTSASAEPDSGGILADARALVDALMNPVPEAAAGPTGPEVATESCNKSYGPTKVPYAEHPYSGKTKAELASVVVLAPVQERTAHVHGASVQSCAETAGALSYGRMKVKLEVALGQMAATAPSLTKAGCW